MQMFLGIASSVVALFGAFLLYLSIAMLLSRGFKLLFGKKDKLAES